MLRGEKLAARFAGIGGVVGNEKFVGIAKQVDVVTFKVATMRITKIQPGNAFEHGGQAGVFIFDGVAQTIAGGVEVGKQPFDVALGGVTAGRIFDGGKNIGQIRIQAFVAVGAGGYISKQLAGVNKIALGFDGIVFDVRGDDVVRQLGVVDAVVIGFDINSEVFADEAVKQGAKHVLLEIPAIDCAAYIIGNRPYLPLQGGALLDACHWVFPVCVFFNTIFAARGPVMG
jgi:hypothetical protein